ncbi:MAG: glycosyltransferase, partial [Fibrobacteres bacterium]|nr:glycosyltransferase [Fibrobacterota bacterium]
LLNRMSNYQNITFHGLLSQNKLSTLLKNIDLHVFPSKSEGQGKVIVEVASARVPTITYSQYGAREWIKDGSEGLVVDEFQDMVSSIKQLLDSPTGLRDLSEGTKDLASRMDPEKLCNKFAEKFIELYKNRY